VAANSRQHPLTADARWLVVKTYALPNPSGEELEQAVKSAREFSAVWESDPRAVIAAWWIAQAYQAHGRADQAVAAYEDFIAGKGYKLPAGEAATKKIDEVGKSPAALKDEWGKMALYCIGQIRYDQRKYDEAMKAWLSYTQKYPNGPQWAASYQGIIEAEYGAAVGALADKKHEEARKLFDAFLAKHPLDERARQILFTFGQVDYADAQKEEEKGEKADKAAAATAYKRAIDQWGRLISQHRGSEEASLAMYRIGQIYEEKLADLDKALESYRELTWGSYAGSARARIAMMTQKSLTVRTDRKFRTNEPAKIRLNVRNIEKIIFKQYNLDLEAYFRKTHTIGSVDALDIDLIQPDKTWEVKIDGYTKYKPIEQTVEVPFADGKAGVCIVNVSEEDLEGTTLVLRSDLDMIVKSSRKESLVFVQNMRTETPAADVDLLLSDGQKVFSRGKTGKDGVYRAVLDELKSVEKLRVFAWSGGSVASDGLELSGLGLARGVSARGYIYTDRSAYQPGQTVKFRSIIR
ncbi:MAG: tetratricopeptide repeat protein, partial [Planctomycetota bacterium]